MFRSNDKLSLILMNARDIDGKLLPFQLKFPLNDKYILPKELVSLDLFEYQEEFNSGKIAFSIYIGEVTTINRLVNEFDKKNIIISKNIEINSIDSPICIKNKIVFANVNEQDIVVGTQEELATVIDQISDNFNVINKSVTNIKMLSKKQSGKI